MQKFEELARLRQSEPETSLEAMRVEREESSKSAYLHPPVLGISILIRV